MATSIVAFSVFTLSNPAPSLRQRTYFSVAPATFAGLGLSAVAVDDGFILAATSGGVTAAGMNPSVPLVSAASANACVLVGVLVFATSNDANAAGG